MQLTNIVSALTLLLSPFVAQAQPQILDAQVYSQDGLPSVSIRCQGDQQFVSLAKKEGEEVFGFSYAEASQNSEQAWSWMLSRLAQRFPNLAQEIHARDISAMKITSVKDVAHSLDKKYETPETCELKQVVRMTLAPVGPDADKRKVIQVTVSKSVNHELSPVEQAMVRLEVALSATNTFERIYTLPNRAKSAPYWRNAHTYRTFAALVFSDQFSTMSESKFYSYEFVESLLYVPGSGTQFAPFTNVRLFDYFDLFNAKILNFDFGYGQVEYPEIRFKICGTNFDNNQSVVFEGRVRFFDLVCVEESDWARSTGRSAISVVYDELESPQK